MSECYDCKNVSIVINCPFLGNGVPSCEKCWRENKFIMGSIYRPCPCAGCNGNKWEEDNGKEE